VDDPRNPLDGFWLTVDDFDYIGADLQRPECILAEPDGTVWSADARGGVVRIAPDGAQQLITQASSSGDGLTEENAARRLIDGTLPNGLAFDRDRNLLISNFGTDRLERMTRDGLTTVLADNIDGEPIGKVNFVCRDSRDRLWVTVSTKAHDWGQTMNPDVADGQLLLYDEGIMRVVADGLAFANECKLDAAEAYVYVAQTCGRNVVRFPITEDGVGEREVYGPADHGRFIDGIAFDAHGNLWGTYVFTDGIFAITPDREARIVFDDSTPDEVARFDEAFRRRAIDMRFLLGTGGSVATWCASLTFGGPDLRDVYVGSLRQTRIPHFRSPVAGLPLVHWSEPIAR
jgi:gluconolactonase